MAPHIRPSTRDDLMAIDALLARSYPKLLKPDYPPSVLVTALPRISKAQPALVTCGTYYVAEDEDGRIAAAGGWTRDRRQEAVGHIRHVVTDADKTRQGYGRALMDGILRAARTAGISDLVCQSTYTAVPFYTAMGFTKIGPLAVELAPGITFPAVVMTRRLSQSA